MPKYSATVIVRPNNNNKNNNRTTIIKITIIATTTNNLQIRILTIRDQRADPTPWPFADDQCGLVLFYNP